MAASLLGRAPAPRRAELRLVRDADQQPIDQCIVIYYPAPRSFTGEDVLELQGHGGPVILDLLLQRVLSLGARLARAGEFSERAFLNGKLDLTQAEAIADLIDSASEQAARSAMRSLQGQFSQRVQRLVEKTVRLRTYIEGALDFPEEEIDFLNNDEIQGGIAECIDASNSLLAMAGQGQRLRDGLAVVIAGPPNVGKSSLLNQLAKRDRAIVSHVPGTTRDTVEEQITIDGVPFQVTDTAGLRSTDDSIEQEGIRRAQDMMLAADRILMVIEGGNTPEPEELAILEAPEGANRITVIRNKIDLYGLESGVRQGKYGVEIALCAKSGEGVERLERHLKECVAGQAAGESNFTARRRHLAALRQAQQRLMDAHEELSGCGAGELAAENLRLAQQAFSQITGEFTTEDLLEEIFSSFCIGK